MSDARSGIRHGPFFEGVRSTRVERGESAMSSLSTSACVSARGRARSGLLALAWVVLVSMSGLAAGQSDSGDGLATVLSETDAAALQGPVFTTQILRGEREFLLVTREIGAGLVVRDAYLFAKSGIGWTRVAQLATKESRIEGTVTADAVVLFGESGQALMQIKLAALRYPEAPAAAPAQ